MAKNQYLTKNSSTKNHIYAKLSNLVQRLHSGQETN